MEPYGTFGRELNQTEGSESGEASGGQRGKELGYINHSGSGIIL